MKWDRIPVWATKRPWNSCRNVKTDQPMEPASLSEVGLKKPDRSIPFLPPKNYQDLIRFLLDAGWVR
jgi:hypothetical protein